MFLLYFFLIEKTPRDKSGLRKDNLDKMSSPSVETAETQDITTMNNVIEGTGSWNLVYDVSGNHWRHILSIVLILYIFPRVSLISIVLRNPKKVKNQFRCHQYNKFTLVLNRRLTLMIRVLVMFQLTLPPHSVPPRMVSWIIGFLVT